MMDVPEITDTELDEWERYITSGWPLGPVVLRLIKALRACRQRAEAKDAALSPLALLPVGAEVASDTDLVIYKNAGRAITIGDIFRARAALDNLPSEAGRDG